MSTGYECQIVKLPEGYVCVLQDWNCPVGAMDWTDYATAYGPATTADEAHDLMSAENANPGGFLRVESPPPAYIEKVRAMLKAKR